MNHNPMILLYPHTYQVSAFLATVLVVLPFALVALGLYFLIIRLMKKRVRRLVDRILVILGLAAFVCFGALIAMSLVTQHQVSKYLGFRYATPETETGELFLITKVTPGGIMEVSGLEVGDVVMMGSTSELYTLLVSHRGGRAVIPVERDGKQLSIQVEVPQMDLPLERYSFLF